MLKRRTKTERLSIDTWRSHFAIWWVAEQYLKALDDEELPTPALGGCDKCGIGIKGNHITWYVNGCGIAPLCQTCWGSLTRAERMPWYRSRWLQQDMNRRYHGCPQQNHIYGLPPFEIWHEHHEWAVVEASVNGGL